MSNSKRLTELEQLVGNIKPKESTKTKDELYKEKICGYQFHKLIPFIYEIQFIKLSNEILDLIKKGDPCRVMEKIHHLQFLTIAVLRGHWGKISLASCYQGMGYLPSDGGDEDDEGDGRLITAA